jgi:NTE family protein
MIPPRRIVLSGGGVKVIAILGALEALEQGGHLRHVQEYCGVSAGAWLGFMLACGCPIPTARALITDLEFSRIRSISTESFLGFPELFGLDTGENLMKFLESITRVALKQDPAITFADLAKHGKYKFRCWASDLVTLEPREFSAERTPTVRVLDALRASMALPLYFTPFPDPLTGHLLGDGGIHGTLPIHHLNDEDVQHALGIGFETLNSKPPTENPSDVFAFMMAILNCLVQDRFEKLFLKWPDKIILIDVSGTQSWNFELPKEDRVNLLSRGRTAVETWFTKANQRRVERRASI